MNTNKYVVGILAHVDSGKTTLAESMLYICGTIRKLGRVDHKDAFLDTYEMERERGITIFSKQAQLTLQDKEITLLDTPGHVDFSAEMERTLQVLDYAILVINGADGVQGHTKTLWKLLKRYGVPAFLFVNKMDQQGTDKEALLAELQSMLDEHCIDFSAGTDCEDVLEDISLCDEELMEWYIEQGKLDCKQIAKAIKMGRLYPVYFGSALKQTGVPEFLQGINEYMQPVNYSDEFGARVFKIARDEQNNRLTFMKVTGGTLRVKMLLEGEGKEGKWQEKINQIRIYSGSQYGTQSEAQAGTVCAVTGLNYTFCGEGIGNETEPELPILEPVLTYRVNINSEHNLHVLYTNLCHLAEEEPELHIVWDEILEEIHVQVMGEVQIDILKHMIWERFHVEVTFDSGSIVYRETIADTVVGIGHFEPLRHYAEVQLLLEPLERGRGLEFETRCSEDILDKNWQRLILTHLEEKIHRGVLTGAEITDMRLTLITGRAHIKHTEGGDFRQATYRAVRQGLKMAKSILLEPFYDFRLEVPMECVGRAMSDIQRMYGNFKTPKIEQNYSVIEGSCPVVTMRDYQKEVISYSHGHGKLFCTLKGYEQCHNEQEVIAETGYDADADLQNPADSVFCAHGAGFVVPWNQVPSYAHVEHGLQLILEEELQEEEIPVSDRRNSLRDGVIAQEEIDEIFARTFGRAKQKRNNWSRIIHSTDEGLYKGTQKLQILRDQKEYLLVDGYNIIFAWEELQLLSRDNMDSARDKLMDIMCNYQGYKRCELILVFDAYKVSGGKGSVFDYHNIHVVYTKEAETADQYIEKVSHELGNRHQVTVATSDRLEQMIIWGAGANRLSAQGLLEEVVKAEQEITSHLEQHKEKDKLYLLDVLPKEQLQKIKENVEDNK